MHFLLRFFPVALHNTCDVVVIVGLSFAALAHSTLNSDDVELYTLLLANVKYDEILKNQHKHLAA